VQLSRHIFWCIFFFFALVFLSITDMREIPIVLKPEKAGIKAEAMKSNMVVDDFNIDEIWPNPFPPSPVKIDFNVPMVCN